jgi:hypothetical protein
VWEALNQPAQIERRLLDDVRYLASDELEGRGIGTLGIELAADYIAEGSSEPGWRRGCSTASRFSDSRNPGGWE